MDRGKLCTPRQVSINFVLAPGLLDLLESFVVLVGEVSEKKRRK